MIATVFKAVKDRAVGNLAGGVDDVVTTWNLQTGQGASYPDPAADGDFWVTCDAEQVRVTGRATDSLTVVRGQNGTSGAAHSGGAGVELRVIAAVIDDITGAISGVEARVGDADTLLVVPAGHNASTVADGAALVNNVGHVGRFSVRERLVFRKWSYIVGVAGNADCTIRFAIYSSDGQTILLDDTHAVADATGPQTIDLGGGNEVTLEPGDYYVFVCMSAGTTGPQLKEWSTTTQDLLNANVPSSEPVFEGTVVVSGGAAPTTIDTDGDITGSAVKTTFCRLDTV